jgi:hypothetical protein
MDAHAFEKRWNKEHSSWELTSTVTKNSMKKYNISISGKRMLRLFWEVKKKLLKHFQMKHPQTKPRPSDPSQAMWTQSLLLQAVLNRVVERLSAFAVQNVWFKIELVNDLVELYGFCSCCWCCYDKLERVFLEASDRTCYVVFRNWRYGFFLLFVSLKMCQTSLYFHNFKSIRVRV